MKTNKMKLALLATAVAGAMFSSAFANGTGTTSTGTTNTGVTHTGIIRHEMRDARHEVRDLRHDGMAQVKELCADLKDQRIGNWESMHTQSWAYSDFLRTTLTADEKKAVEDLWKKHVNERNAIVSGTGTDAEKVAALKVSLSGALAAIKVYVAADKVAAYDIFVAARIQAIETNFALKTENKEGRAACQEARKAMKEDIKEKAQSIRKVLSVKITTELNAKLDSIPTEKKEVVYNKLILRIDMLIAQTKSERVKAILEEVKAHVEVRLALMATDE